MPTIKRILASILLAELMVALLSVPLTLALHWLDAPGPAWGFLLFVSAGGVCGLAWFNVALLEKAAEKREAALKKLIGEET